MAVSRSSRRNGSIRPLLGLVDRISWYDLLLVLLPLGFAVSLVAHVLTAIPFQIAIAGGALFGLVVLVDALFVHPPVDNPPRTTQ
ncbi:hypothetical protein [Salinibaculum salinum]|uniref:hypothetical protein n=1 Tax=Salinibaculum salinum TaxID=3131996 RepID=UPI0030EDFC19